MARGKHRRPGGGGPSLQSPAARRPAPRRTSVAAATDPDPDRDLATLLDAQWHASRHGAIAGRGYHYQDAVGAWLAARMLAGLVDIDRLVPEGLDDLSCEGPVPRQVQVKSRQARVGDFSIGHGARHVLKAWQRHSGLPTTASQKLVLVFERPVAGYAPDDWDVPLGDHPDGAELAAEVQRLAAQHGLSASEISQLMQRASVLVLPQTQLHADAADLIGARTRLPSGATVPVMAALRTAVAHRADHNGEVGWDQRGGLSRTDVELLVTRTAEMIDVAALQEAVSSGACEPVDFDTPLDTPGFYSGTGVQPGHVAAGLVVPRPGETDEVLAGLDATGSVLIVGPSGIGKSAVLWMAGYVARHVTWYHVRRLQVADVEPLVRLARAAAGGRHAPVGFLVDGVGIGELTAWDALHRRVVGMPEVLLVGSVREEDVPSLATGSEVVHVRPQLDETVAARIHAELRDREVTATAHWREAFEAAGGLTLEFTHLLTRGRRLRDVVGQQVADRIRDGRTVELAALAPVSVSDRWGASLSVEALTALIGASASDLQAALSRLVNEHVITVRNGSVSGLHPLRSAALCEAVHRVPPPLLSSTVRDVTGQLDSPQLAGFVARLLAAESDLDRVLIRALADRLAPSAMDDVALAAAALNGLRLADFTRTARRWADLLEAHAVPPPMRPLALNLAMIDTEVGEWFDPRVVAAVAAIQAKGDDSSSPLRDALLAEVGADRLTAMLENDQSRSRATALLAAMAGSGLHLGPTPDSPFGGSLKDAPLDELANLIEAASAVSPTTGQALLHLAGEAVGVVDRFLEAEPWLLNLDVVHVGSEKVLRGQVLHVSDRVNPNPRAYVVEIARRGLQCLPDVDRADLATVTASGEALGYGGHIVGSTGLLRRYAASQTVVSWNRTRARYASSLVAAESTTVRLAHGLAVVERTGHLLDHAAELWVAARGGQQLQRLSSDRQRLAADIEQLMPRPIRDPVADPEDERVAGFEDDPMHSLTHGVVRNLVANLFNTPQRHAATASVAREMLLPRVAELEIEPWQLLGFEKPPPILAHIRTTLTQLADVLDELAAGHTTPSTMATLTRSWPRDDRLRLAARIAADRAAKRYQASCDALRGRAAEHGWQIQTLTRPDNGKGSWPPLETALVVTLDGFERYEETMTGLADLVAGSDLPRQSADLIPLIASAVQPRFAARAQSGKLFPAPGIADPWLPLLDVPLETPAADAIATALAGLYELSALALLDSRRTTGPDAQAAVDEAAQQIRQALEALGTLPQDGVVALLHDAVADLAQQVQLEFDASQAVSAGAFAGALSAGLTVPTDELANANFLLALATHWDSDPSVAISWLD